MQTEREWIHKQRGLHVIVYAGDGTNRPAERLFDTGSCGESEQLCDLLLRLLDERKAQTTA